MQAILYPLKLLHGSIWLAIDIVKGVEKCPCIAPVK